MRHRREKPCGPLTSQPRAVANAWRFRAQLAMRRLAPLARNRQALTTARGWSLVLVSFYGADAAVTGDEMKAAPRDPQIQLLSQRRHTGNVQERRQGPE